MSYVFAKGVFHMKFLLDPCVLFNNLAEGKRDLGLCLLYSTMLLFVANFIRLNTHKRPECINISLDPGYRPTNPSASPLIDV